MHGTFRCVIQTAYCYYSSIIVQFPYCSVQFFILSLIHAIHYATDLFSVLWASLKSI